jgi:hypothetical protein
MLLWHLLALSSPSPNTGIAFTKTSLAQEKSIQKSNKEIPFTQRKYLLMKSVALNPLENL